MEYLVSSDDIQRLFPKIQIIKYSDIHKINNVYDMIDNPHKACFILYQDSVNSGHWCLLFERKDGILEFFDPYGLEIDKQHSFFNDKTRKYTNQDKPYLTYLLLTNGDNIEYNNHRFQKMKDGINTCGKWCIHRLIYDDLTLDEYYNMFKKYKNKDKKINELINKIL